MAFLIPVALAAGGGTFLGITFGRIGFALVRLGVSLLLNAAAAALGPKPRLPDLKRDLARETELPKYRFVYGRDRAVGTPMPVRVRGRYIYACYLLNSRPSLLTDVTLSFDNRNVTLTGDPFDFAGPGAETTTEPIEGYVRVWFGRGDQSGPPAEILTAAPWASGADEDLFLSTDRWQGRTVMWARFDSGPSEGRSERWPAVPPAVHVIANWSKVWDPRDLAQDADDPATWTYSDNLALCILDAARSNPVKGYPLSALILDQFIAAADNADERVDLLAGGDEARYRTRGTVIWDDSELEDQLLPLFEAGAARAIKQGGMLGIAPGAWVTPDFTLTDFVGGSMEIIGTQAGDLPTQLRTSYVSAARLFEAAELPPYDIPGAQAADGGLPRVMTINCDFAGSPTQAQRVQKIRGNLERRQREIKLTAWPEAVNLVAGATLNCALPSPYSRFNGTFEVRRIQPALALTGNDGGMALRCPLTFVEHREAFYDWAFAVDEIEILDQPFDSVPTPVDGVGTIDVTTGPGVDTVVGGISIPRVRFAFDPLDNYPLNYVWQIKVTGGPYGAGGAIAEDVRDGSSKVFGFTGALSEGTEYMIRVRSAFERYVGGSNNGTAQIFYSDWVESAAITTVTPTFDLGLPIDGSATGGTGQIILQWTTPNSADFVSLEIYVSLTNDVNAAALLTNIFSAANTARTFVHSGLGAAATRFYFARSRGPSGSVSAWTASVTATTT
jgi:hypothetical protein